ncbi:MAG TPA: hypothetical protein VNK24_04250 [Elusimicrobiota bacterium]|nr:hypothetical protein [Elusimicrobiota bacterium]
MGACVPSVIFSHILMTLKEIDLVENNQFLRLTTAGTPVDLEAAHFSGIPELIAAGFPLPGAVSGVHLIIDSVSGVRADNGQTVQFSLSTPTVDVPLPFGVSSATLSDAKIFFNLVTSIQQTGPDSYEFVPTLRNQLEENHAWAIALSTGLIQLRVGQSTTTPVLVTNLGNSTDTFDLSFFTSNSDVGSVLSSSVTINPGATAMADLTLTAPVNIGTSTAEDIPFEIAAVADYPNLSHGLVVIPNPQSSSGVLEVIKDIEPPRTTLAVSTPNYVSASSVTFVTGRSTYTLSSIDDLVSVGDAQGLGVAFQEVGVDSAPALVFMDSNPAVGQVFNSAFSLSYSSDGLHTVDYFAQDVVGNREAVHVATIAVDNTPPISFLAIGEPNVALSRSVVLVSSMTPMVIVSTDPVLNGVASGVSQSFVSIGTAPPLANAFSEGGGDVRPPASTTPFAVVSGTFTLAQPDGPYALSFYSVDHVGNAEVAKSSSVVLDSTPPLVLLRSPSASEAGLCSVFSGKVPIVGTVTDAHLQGYVLDFAPGVNAATGWTIISSGTVAVSSGTLGVWNTANLSGYQTLRLTASDLLDNVTIATMTVYVGNPSLLLALEGGRGNGRNGGGFNKPTGVAVGPNGNIYVADTNNDQVEVFTATGVFISAFGRGDGPKDDPDDRIQGRISLNKPKDVKVDAAGNIFVADTNNNRVIEVSPSGQVLLQLSRQKGNEERKDHDDPGDFDEMSHPGNAKGSFNHPSGLALDSRGDIYVSDTNNNRIEEFDPLGNFIEAFSLPSIVPPAKPEDPDQEDSGLRPQRHDLGTPYGIAVDSSGVIYAADAQGDRVLKFAQDGTLLSTIGGPGNGVGQFHRPEGVAVDPDGGCLYVSDRNNDRIERFDPLGNATLVFGALGNIQAKNAGLVFNNPAGLALDDSGNLFVADRNNDAIEEYGAPTAASPALVRISDVTQELVRAHDGGDLKRNDRAEVDIPPGALNQDMEISIAPETAPAPADALMQAQSLRQNDVAAVSSGVVYGPEGTQFNKPVTIVLPYNPAALPPGTDLSKLAVYYWNPQLQDWQAYASAVNPSSFTVSAQTMHFSLYQLMAPAAAPQDTASNTVATVQIACNPLRPGCQPLKFKNLPAGARLRIYTLTGALVKDMNSDAKGDASWDGTNQSGAPCATGVYFVFAQGNGTTKTFKAAIQR